MQKIAWATDLHLNFATYDAWESFVQEVKASGAEALLIGGDISESEDFAWQLRRLANTIKVPIHFVLGNHDFYRGSFLSARKSSSRLAASEPLLTYLTDSAWVHLSDQVYLVGDDCPADSLCGDALKSPVQLYDFHLIEEYDGLSKTDRLEVMRHEGHQAAIRLENKMTKAAEAMKRPGVLLVLTHAPPFREACWHEGRLSDDDWAPYFVCHSAGDMLRRWCEARPDKMVIVLCGHTHGGGKSRVLSNLVCITAAAEYSRPNVAGVFELSQLGLEVATPFDFDVLA